MNTTRPAAQEAIMRAETVKPVIVEVDSTVTEHISIRESARRADAGIVLGETREGHLRYTRIASRGGIELHICPRY